MDLPFIIRDSPFGGQRGPPRTPNGIPRSVPCRPSPPATVSAAMGWPDTSPDGFNARPQHPNPEGARRRRTISIPRSASAARESSASRGGRGHFPGQPASGRSESGTASRSRSPGGYRPSDRAQAGTRDVGRAYRAR
jgi:hypothetical protein